MQDQATETGKTAVTEHSGERPPAPPSTTVAADSGDPDKAKGLYAKYQVFKNERDGSIGARVSPCFVLRLDGRDAYAAAALERYAQECAQEFPLLASDLFDIVDRLRGEGRYEPSFHALGGQDASVVPDRAVTRSHTGLDSVYDERSLPSRIVVDQNGHYWRDFGGSLSMCPTTDKNEPTEAKAVFVRVHEGRDPGDESAEQ